jgi:hypothetical protein
VEARTDKSLFELQLEAAEYSLEQAKDHPIRMKRGTTAIGYYEKRVQELKAKQAKNKHE